MFIDYSPCMHAAHTWPVRLAYKLYFFSQRIVFFSHNKSANDTFSYGLSAKRIGQCLLTNFHYFDPSMPVTDLSIYFTHPPTVVIYLLNKNKRCRRAVGHGSPGDSRQQMKSSCRIIIDAIAISWPDLVFFCFVFTLLYIIILLQYNNQMSSRTRM